MLLDYLWRLRRHLGLVLGASTVLVFLAGAGFVAFEDKTVTSYGDGIWWALSLMTTVGFVGESPQTTGGRVVAAVLMVVGFGLMSVVTATISSLFVSREQRPEFDQELASDSALADHMNSLTEAVAALTEQHRQLQQTIGEMAATLRERDA